MKSIALTLLVALSTGPLGAQEPKFDWRKISTEKSEIMFPGTPQDNGKKGSGQWELKRQGGGAALILMTNDMPQGADVSNAEFVKTSMDNGRKTTIASRLGALGAVPVELALLVLVLLVELVVRRPGEGGGRSSGRSSRGSSPAPCTSTPRSSWTTSRW